MSASVVDNISEDCVFSHNFDAPWSLADTLFALFFIIAGYLMVVTMLIPNFMANKPPFKLYRILQVYNAFQVVFSGYIVLIYAKYMFKYGIITTRCPQNEELKEVIESIKPYFIAKHLDLLDTVFFVLRKKDNQVTFLHLYHHTAMVSWTWLHLMYHPTDNFVVVGLLNSFVHVLMYAYYGLASLGPKYEKFLWWKKHLTKIQLIQFILVILHLHYQQTLSPCPIPTFFHCFTSGCIGTFFVLFLSFYFKSYNAKKTDVKKDDRKHG